MVKLRFPLSTRHLRHGLAAIALGVFAPCVHAADRGHQREQFSQALDAARHGRDWKAFALDLADYPLYPWLGETELVRRLDKLERKDVEAFLTTWPGTLAAQDLREAYLGRLAAQGQWSDFLALYVDSPRRDLQCHALSARLAGGAKLDFDRDLAALWQSAGALPPACDAMLDRALDQGAIDTMRLWQRIERARDAGQPAAIEPLIARLPAGDRPAAQRTAAALRDPATTLKQAAGWPDDERHRAAALAGVVRLAHRDSDAAETVWPKLDAHFHFTEKQRHRVAAVVAVDRAASFAPDAAARLAALPAAAQDDRTREWRVRLALAAMDWSGALAALDALSTEQQADPEWRYLRARVLTKLDRRAEAEPLFAALAGEAGYFSFLSADWLERPYAICPLQPAGERQAGSAPFVAQGELERAFEWFALDRLPEARRAWDFAYAKLTADQRRLALDLAYREGWYDRAVYHLNKGDELKLYEMRFPLARETQVRRESTAAGLDPAWTYAIIRAESAWTTDARSAANAYGLMQLLPSTAAKLAKTEGIPYARAEDLFHPDTNIALGARYLATMAGRHGGSPWLASAAYNAGATPVARWLAARSQLEPDLFIATIPYRETREYVARVLAYSVIYDWRLNGKAVAMGARMPRAGQTYAPPGDDTPRKAVGCPAAPTATTTAAASAPPARRDGRP